MKNNSKADDWRSPHLLLLDLLCQACQHYSPTCHHILQCTKLPLEQDFPEKINQKQSSLEHNHIYAQIITMPIFPLLISSMSKGRKNLLTCSDDVWNALYNALTVYPWRSEALLITTIRACHTSSFTKFPAY